LVSSSATALIHFPLHLSIYFFSSDLTSTPDLYTLSLHDALPIFSRVVRVEWRGRDKPIVDREPHPVVAQARRNRCPGRQLQRAQDRKSTRLNSSHVAISYAVFCLKKKKQTY